MSILDQFGNPISTRALDQPQTLNIPYLGQRHLESMIGRLEPSRLANALREADNGNLLEQHRLFADMEERDTHLLAEMNKRKHALTGIDWDIVPPRKASAAEKADAEWAKEVIEDLTDPLEDLILAMSEAIGHGFACIELEWQRCGTDWLPGFFPRPQEWFHLDYETRSQLRLADGSATGQALRPFGWIWHTHGKARSGYMGRLGLYRALVWPFMYKTFAVGDMAEFLELYGLPLITGKYGPSATEQQKRELFRAVNSLGHNGRAIMPEEMQLEIAKITNNGDASPHMTMITWAEKSQSKAILGATLTSQADGKSSTNALGKIHDKVRRDILEADARQIGATLTRDLVYPLLALNRGATDLRRCPRFVLDVSEPEDLNNMATALDKLAAMFEIPVSWAREKTGIPAPQAGEAILRVARPELTLPPQFRPVAPEPDKPAPAPNTTLTNTALAVTALGKSTSAVEPPDELAPQVEQLAAQAAPQVADWLAQIRGMMDQAGSLEELGAMLEAAFPALDQQAMTDTLAQAISASGLAGRYTVAQEVQDAQATPKAATQ
jgi:phage gp29-like protein